MLHFSKLNSNLPFLFDWSTFEIPVLDFTLQVSIWELLTTYKCEICLLIIYWFHVHKLCIFCDMKLAVFSNPFCWNTSVSIRVLRHGDAIKLQISLQWLTYSQSVSPVSAPILSQPIHSAYLPSPRWWDAICKGCAYTNTQTHTVCCAVPPVMASWLSISCLYGGDRITAPTPPSHVPPPTIYTIKVQLLSILLHLMPCWRMYVCRGSFCPSQTTQRHFVAH